MTARPAPRVTFSKARDSSAVVLAAPARATADAVRAKRLKNHVSLAPDGVMARTGVSRVNAVIARTVSAQDVRGRFLETRNPSGSSSNGKKTPAAAQLSMWPTRSSMRYSANTSRRLAIYASSEMRLHSMERVSDSL